jgi:hypothetical protein
MLMGRRKVPTPRSRVLLGIAALAAVEPVKGCGMFGKHGGDAAAHGAHCSADKQLPAEA